MKSEAEVGRLRDALVKSLTMPTCAESEREIQSARLSQQIQILHLNWVLGEPIPSLDEVIEDIVRDIEAVQL